jgi:hypothetical protein
MLQLPTDYFLSSWILRVQLFPWAILNLLLHRSVQNERTVVDFDFLYDTEIPHHLHLNQNYWWKHFITFLLAEVQVPMGHEKQGVKLEEGSGTR